MRDRGAFGLLAVILIVTIVFFAIATDDSRQSENEDQENNGPTVMINGRSFEPGYNDETGRMIIVVDQDDLFVGENTVEIHWGNQPSPTMTAKLPSEVQQH